MHIQNQHHKTWAALVSALGVTVLAFLFAFWWMRHPDITPAGWVSAFLSATLFGVLGVRLVYWWFESWAGVLHEEAPSPRIAEPLRKRDILGVFLALLGVEAGFVLLVFSIQVMEGCQDPLKVALDIWTKTDSQHYLAIAEDWYLSQGELDRLVQLVFLPGYPLLMRFFQSFMGDYLHGGMLASALCFAGGGSILYCLARLDGDHQRALRAVKYTCLLPGAFFFAAPMSESLFFLLSVSCVYCGRKNRFALAGLLGGLAAFTRSLGLTLLAPVCFDFIQHLLTPGQKPAGKTVLRGLSILLIPLGFLAYCAICKDVSGEWFKFMEYQSEHWHQSIGLFFNTAAYQMEYAIARYEELNYASFIGLWIPNLFCSFLCLTVMALSVRRQHAGHTAYFIGYFVIAIGATWLLSAPRYLLVLFPVSIGLADLTEKRSADSFATALLAVISTLYTFMFAWRWQVW